MIPHLWGYPATLSVNVEGVNVLVSKAIVEERGRFVIDTEKVLDAIDRELHRQVEARETWYTSPSL